MEVDPSHAQNIQNSLSVHLMQRLELLQVPPPSRGSTVTAAGDDLFQKPASRRRPAGLGYKKALDLGLPAGSSEPRGVETAGRLIRPDNLVLLLTPQEVLLLMFLQIHIKMIVSERRRRRF